MRMQALLSSCILSLSATAMADPAVYRDARMTIASGVLISDTRQQYYRDIVLEADSSGKLKVVAASPRPLVMIDSFVATVTEDAETRAVELTIAGNKSVPCVELEEVAVSRKDEVFTVLLAETVLGPAESCIAVLDPFEISLPLDVKGLDSGTYKVVVNGMEGGFVLTQDEPLPGLM